MAAILYVFMEFLFKSFQKILIFNPALCIGLLILRLIKTAIIKMPVIVNHKSKAPCDSDILTDKYLRNIFM